MILCDSEIRQLAMNEKMIIPFVERTKEVEGKLVLSYGLGSYGYDIRLSNRFKCCYGSFVLDPKETSMEDFESFESNNVILEPNSFILGLSVEFFNMPIDVIGVCVGKSTYARRGVSVNITPLEPGWKGYLVIEIANLGKTSVKLYPNEGIAQILFFRGSLCEHSYLGSYQNQMGFRMG